ncbi:MAG TPA: DEAD/DEAH box helicase [Anaerolineales bacterium]
MTGVFHPLVQEWFEGRFGPPTEAQARGWPAIAAGKHTLIAAPTGAGKTLAAFLWSIDRLVQVALADRLEARTYVIYVSPLKALSNDVRKNLQEPLAAIQDLAVRKGLNRPEIRAEVRTGDTPASARRAMLKHPPHILITTPESLYILLTAEGSRGFLSTAETVIVDEIHAVAGDKRGSHLSLTLERLDRLAGRRLQRIGLSATQRPIEEIAQLLVGGDDADCTIVDFGHRRELDLRVEVTEQELGPIATHELWSEIYDRVVEHARQQRTTLVYVNTRRLAERVTFQLSARLGEGKVAAHHGSLSRQARLAAEQGLKSGAIPVVVATASLELGIDIGSVDLVIHLGTPRSLASLLQRVGRSAHRPGAVEIPRGILFPLTRDELLQSAAAVQAVRAGELDRVIIPRAPLDILAQQIVAITASEEIGQAELYDLIRRAYPFRSLSRGDFEAALEMVSEGVASSRGRRSAHVHHDRVNDRLRGRRGARLAAITGGGAIPDTADYDVVEQPDGRFVGRVNEDFAIESAAGDIFLLGNRSWRIRRVASGKVHVEDAQGAPPNIPFWLGEAPGRTPELSAAVSRLRAEVRTRLKDIPNAVEWLMGECGVDRAGAEQIVAYISETVSVLGEVPTRERIIAERFFDEAGGMQLVVHAPFGSRINRAWGLAMRKRFCVTFDFELQAAATDDGFVLSLGEQHSFPVQDVYSLVRANQLDETLVQAVLAVPMFTNRWRWNATRALALLRFSGGRKVPMAIQRMRAEDLLAAVFPAQVMCQDNRAGPVEVPDHPLVNQTIRDCLHEAMDLEGLREILLAIERGEIATIALDTTAPSPISHEILNANPYAFLDDAPLEERRARAVALRRTDPDLARGIGALDPEAIDQVRAQAWPDVRDPDELHDALLNLVIMPLEEAAGWSELAERLVDSGRAIRATWSVGGADRAAWVAAERIVLLREVIPSIRFEPEIQIPDPNPRERGWIERGEVPRLIVQGWLECIGPTTAAGLARRLGLPLAEVEIGLAQLEGAGIVLRGQFTPHAAGDEPEWCDRRLLARIHRRTINKLRREIQTVSASDFIRFLLRWQHVFPGTQLQGQEGVLHAIRQLQGLELPAPAWEHDLLPARVEPYSPADLEGLCLAGIIAWGRLRLNESEQEPTLRRPTRSAPLSFVVREELPYWIEPFPAGTELRSQLSPVAADVLNTLERVGASFQSDLQRATGHLGAQVEGALWELVANGLVTGDGLAGLRSLLRPADLRRRAARARSRRPGFGPLGRWAVLRRESAGTESEIAGLAARQLLRRYGVVIRELLARETRIPTWRALLRVYREMEARGEIRGGRFVDGFVGEQFALPEAVDELRRVRRNSQPEPVVMVSAADPLNLIGILTPGSRVSPHSNQVILYERGVPVDVGELGAVRHRLQRSSLPEFQAREA